MAQQDQINLIKLMNKMNKEVYKWTNMKLVTILDIKSRMEIKLFNIQERFNNQWDKNLSQENKRERKLKKGKNKNKKRSEKKLKKENNN